MLKQRIAWHGPFVMTTQDEIRTAISECVQSLLLACIYVYLKHLHAYILTPRTLLRTLACRHSRHKRMHSCLVRVLNLHEHTESLQSWFLFLVIEWAFRCCQSGQQSFVPKHKCTDCGMMLTVLYFHIFTGINVALSSKNVRHGITSSTLLPPQVPIKMVWIGNSRPWQNSSSHRRVVLRLSHPKSTNGPYQAMRCLSILPTLRVQNFIGVKNFKPNTHTSPQKEVVSCQRRNWKDNH